MPGFKVGDAPAGTNRRIRDRAIWAVAFFAASVPPAIVGIGITNASSAQVNVATPIAFGLWTFGLLFALWAAVPTLRYWEVLPQATRSLCPHKCAGGGFQSAATERDPQLKIAILALTLPRQVSRTRPWPIAKHRKNMLKSA